MSIFSTDTLILAFQIAYITTALGTIIIVISENRNPIKTMSWVLVLLFLPLIGLIIYYFFGEDHRKQRLISRKMHKKLIRRPISKNNAGEIANNYPEDYHNLIGLLNRLKNAPLYGGNNITFYSDGIAKFNSLCEEIRKAKKYIHIQYYIFMDDNIGTTIKNLLIEKAKQGLEVRLLYDDVGSWKANKKFFQSMLQHGVQVQSFLKVAFPILTSRVNYRNHRKVVIIDGTVGFMGGMNVADRYIEGINGGIWRDSHFKLQGYAIQGLHTSFATDWYATCSEFLSSEKYLPHSHQSEGDNLMQIVTSGPMGEFKEIHQGIFQAILNAKKYVYIQSPYFIPTDTLLLAIQTAAQSGVDVRIMIPKKSDTTFVQIATLSYIKNLLDAKVKVYFFTNGFIHSKLLVVDDKLTITGSANMDVRSFEHNFEIEAFIYNTKTSMEAKNIFMKDLADSEPVIAEMWNKRSRYIKFSESVLRLFTPLL